MSIEQTPDGTPYLSDQSYLSETPPYTRDLSARIDELAARLPVGAIMPYMGATAPDYWLLCDGSEYFPGDLPELYAVNSVFHANEAPGQFRVPDLRGRAPFGAAGSVPTTDSDIAAPFTLGRRYGDARVPTHAHTFIGAWSAFPGGSGALNNNTGYVQSPNWNGSWTTNGFGSHTTTDQLNPHGLSATISPNGAGRNVPPGTGVNFIVYAGRSTTGISPISELPPVTTRDMIEARLAEAGIGEEEVKMLKEQLAELKESHAE